MNLSFDIVGITVLPIVAAPIIVTLTLILSRAIVTWQVSSGRASSSQILELMEVLDRVSWFALLGAALFILLTLRFSYRVRSFNLTGKRLDIITFLGIGTSVVSLIFVVPYKNVQHDGLWSGFGIEVVLLALALICGVYLLGPRLLNVQEGVSWLVASTVVAIYFPVIIRTPWGLGDQYHNRYITSEILSVSAGKTPLYDFVGQYTTGLGFAFAPVHKALLLGGASRLTSDLILFGFINLLVIACLIGAIYIGLRSVPKNLWALPFVVLIPLILIHGQPTNTDTGSITSILSAVPIRLLPVVLVGVVVISILTKEQVSSWHLIAAGSVAGIAPLINFEFGFVSLIGGGIIIFFSQRSLSRGVGFCSIYLLSSLSLIFSAFFGMTYILNKPPKVEYLVLFAGQFFNGFGAEPMPILGPHLFIVGVLLAGVSLGAWTLTTMNLDTFPSKNERGVRRVTRFAALVALYFGITGLGAFGYYVGRSVVSTQLQIFLTFLGLVGLAIFSIFLSARGGDFRKWGPGVAVLVLTPLALGSASVIQAPDPNHEWARVIPHEVAAYTSENHLSDVGLVRDALFALQATYGLEHKDVVTSVANGAHVSISLGTRDVSPINDPADAWNFNGSIRSIYCSVVTSRQMPVLAQSYINDLGEPLCFSTNLIRRIDENFTLILPHDW